MKYVKLEHKVNLETIGNIRNSGKKSVSATESSLLAIAKADTEFFIFSPFCWVGLGNQ